MRYTELFETTRQPNDYIYRGFHEMQRNLVIVAMFFAMIVVGIADGQSASSTPTTISDNYPEQPIKVIVPFGAGGGSDTFVRILQKAIKENELLPQPMVIINVPGAGGTIGSRQVMESEPDGYTLLCLHEGIISAKYAGSADYGPEAFEPVAGTGEVGNVIAVAGDSKYTNLDQLLTDAVNRPEEIVFSANIGAPSHFVGLMLESAKPGARFRYTQTGGGAKRFAALAGGHIDVSAFSLAEYMQFKSAGLRALAYCTETRHPSAPEIPTAVEQGFDVINSTMQFWWAPKNTPPEKTRFFADVLQKSMQTRQVQEALEAIQTDNVFLAGDSLRQSLAMREQRFANVAQRELTKTPDFPKLVLGIVVLLSLVVCFQTLPNRQTTPSKRESAEATQAGYSNRPWLAFVSIVGTAAYVLVMQMNWVGFRVSTFVFIFGLGLLLTGMKVKQLPMTLAIALAMSLGLHFVFTNVFAIVLP
ncbi:MAG: tripartite-type tricarboxylate transporter receptor subunit TctC [Mariniblastus sp.]|jgi:tripartite-type tricarboxylate transporter receptor subunit TctC